MTKGENTVELRLAISRDHLLEQLGVTGDVAYYSQENCILLGLRKRKFLEILRRTDAPPVIQEGKLRLVAKADMIAYLERLRNVQPKAVAELDDAERLLLSMGCAPRTRKAG